MHGRPETAIVVMLFFVFSMNTFAGDFRSYYTKISSAKSFENYSCPGDYADIVVEVMVGKLTFWRGSGFSALLGEWSRQVVNPL